MYCRSCGKDVPPGAVACIGCGLPPAAGAAFCALCGSSIQSGMPVCPKCGVKSTGTPARSASASPDEAKLALKMPATFLMAVSCLAFVTSLPVIIIRPVENMDAAQKLFNLMGDTANLAAIPIGMGGAAFIFFGAFQMMKLKRYTLCVIASAMAIVPCMWNCCILGIPFGIWALVVLLKPHIKSNFS